MPPSAQWKQKSRSKEDGLLKETSWKYRSGKGAEVPGEYPDYVLVTLIFTSFFLELFSTLLLKCPHLWEGEFEVSSLWAVIEPAANIFTMLLPRQFGALGTKSPLPMNGNFHWEILLHKLLSGVIRTQPDSYAGPQDNLAVTCSALNNHYRNT